MGVLFFLLNFCIASAQDSLLNTLQSEKTLIIQSDPRDTQGMTLPIEDYPLLQNEDLSFINGHDAIYADSLYRRGIGYWSGSDRDYNKVISYCKLGYIANKKLFEESLKSSANDTLVSQYSELAGKNARGVSGSLRRQGDYSGASTFFNEVRSNRKLWETIPIKTKIALLNLEGLIYADLDEKLLAKESYEEGLSLFTQGESINLKTQKINLLNNLFDICMLEASKILYNEKNNNDSDIHERQMARDYILEGENYLLSTNNELKNLDNTRLTYLSKFDKMSLRMIRLEYYTILMQGNSSEHIQEKIISTKDDITNAIVETREYLDLHGEETGDYKRNETYFYEKIAVYYESEYGFSLPQNWNSSTLTNDYIFGDSKVSNKGYFSRLYQMTRAEQIGNNSQELEAREAILQYFEPYLEKGTFDADIAFAYALYSKRIKELKEKIKLDEAGKDAIRSKWKEEENRRKDEELKKELAEQLAENRQFIIWLVSAGAGLIFLMAGLFWRQKGEKDKARELVHTLLVASYGEKVVEKMIESGGKIQPRFHKSIGTAFLDMKGFDVFAQSIRKDLGIDEGTEKMLHILDLKYKLLDIICEAFGVSPVKTIGDGYMAASGMLLDDDDPEALKEELINLYDASSASAWFMEKHFAEFGGPFQARLGIADGRAGTGQLGKKLRDLDVIGEYVNVSARLESAGAPGKIYVSLEYYNAYLADYIATLGVDMDTFVVHEVVEAKHGRQIPAVVLDPNPRLIAEIEAGDHELSQHLLTPFWKNGFDGDDGIYAKIAEIDSPLREAIEVLKSASLPLSEKLLNLLKPSKKEKKS